MIKSTLREIKTSLARYLAIFAIVALGVGFFAGLKNCKPSMISTASNYLEEHNFYDYQIVSSYGIDDESVEIARSWKNVSGAEGSVQVDVMAESGDGDSKALKAISLPESINTLNLSEGRLPENNDECVVDAYSVGDEGYQVGDTITLSDENDKDRLKQFRGREFRIVGTVNTPIYLDYQRGSTDIGDGSLNTFFFIKKDAFDLDYYTAMYLTLTGDEEPFTEELDDRLDSEEDSMKELAETVTAARRDTARREAQEELDEKIQEYEDNLAEYEKEKADAEAEIDSAENKLDKGQKKIDSLRKDARGSRKELEQAVAGLNAKKKELQGTISGLKAQKESAEAGLAKASESRAGIEQLHEAGQMSDEEYAAAISEIEAQEQQARAGISQLEEGIAQAEAGISQIDDNLAKAEAGLDKTEAGLKELDKQEKKIDKNRRTLKEKEAEADDEFAKAQKKLDDAKEKLDEAQQKIDDMETGNSYAFSRGDNAGYSSFDSNSGIVSNIAKVFPVFFFLIAALVCMTTMTRMIDEQRTQIGVLKALGYSNSAIVGKYMFYSGSAALIGAITGFFAGCKIFPYVIWQAYTMMYDFCHTVDFVIEPSLGILSVAAALVCSMGATWVSIAQDFRVAPADLIRPKTPPAGRRILLERITPVWKRISFLYKVSIRNIFRDKKRFLMMVIGVSGCTALLIAGMGIRTTIAKVADHQFGEISLYDYVVVFNKNMNEKRQAGFLEYMAEETEVTADEVIFLHQGEVTLTMDGGSLDVTCTVGDPDRMGQFIDMHHGSEPVPYPGPGEVVIVSKIHHDYGAKPGDTVTIRDGYKEMTAVVSGVLDNYVYDSIYMSPETYEAGFGRKAEIKSAMVRMSADPGKTEDTSPEANADEEAIRASSTHAANYEYTAAVSVNLDVRDSVTRMMRSLDAVVYVVILSAALLAFIVLYNLTNINITERIREIATIKVLGFNQLEVSQYVFRENIFMTAVAAAVGIPMGRWLLKFVIDNIVVKMIFFEPRLSNTDIVLAVILTFVFAGVVNLAMQRRLRNVSMTESLKSVE